MVMTDADMEQGTVATHARGDERAFRSGDDEEVEDAGEVEECWVRWSRITKTVRTKEDNGGLLRSSISRKEPSTPPTNDDHNHDKDGLKSVLRNVSGAACPGELVALIGPSGSGKTSLLDVLSGRSAYEKGRICVNGREAVGPVMKRFKRKVAYVKQADVFFGHLTVRDQLTYTALLRLPSSVSRRRKHAEVSRILSLLRLRKCADTPIRLLSGGERKRVNIGTELLTDPRVVLLDEPTSGLDSSSAVSLMRVLHRLAKTNRKTIVTSIHQPSSAVFRSFHKIIVLAEGGLVYHGAPVDGLNYLRERGLACPDGYNAADHWMDLLVVDSTADAVDDDDDNDEDELGFGSFGKQRTPDFPVLEEEEEEKKCGDDDLHHRVDDPRSFLLASWDSEAFAKRVDGDVRADAASSLVVSTSFLDKEARKFNASWSEQFVVLVHRCLRNARSAIFTPLNVIKSVVVGVIMGLVWFQVPYTEARSNDLVSYFFFTMTHWVLDSMFKALMSFPSERTVVYKERASGSYRLSAYFAAKSVAETPTTLALPFLYMVLSYWLAGIHSDVGVFLGTTGCCLLATLAGQSYGLMVSACIMDFEKAVVVMLIIGLSLMVLGGFYVETIPSWISWLKYLSPFKYAFDASQMMVFDRDLPCDGSGRLEACRGKQDGFVSPEVMIELSGAEGGVAFNVCMLIVLFLVPRYFAYLFLSKKKGSERS